MPTLRVPEVTFTRDLDSHSGVSSEPEVTRASEFWLFRSADEPCCSADGKWLWPEGSVDSAE